MQPARVFNRLSTYTADGVTASYVYDGDNLRQSKTVNGETVNHILDGANVVADVRADGTNAYVYGNGVELFKHNGQTSRYTKSYRGDVTAVTTGDERTEYFYDNFGNKKKDTDTSTNPFEYCGEYFDDETGLIYLRNRYYDPTIGRFITEDPIRDGENWYVYAGNNPVSFVDPNGLEVLGDEKYGLNSKVYIALVILGDAWEAFPNYRDDISNVANEVRWIADTRGVEKVETSIKYVLKVSKNLSTVEQILVAGYPDEALVINAARKMADDETRTIFKQEGNGTDDANAFKHAYWNALSASKIGTKMTKLFTDAHEFGWAGENVNDIDAMIMDLNNNEIGRKIGSNYNPNYHLYTLKQSVMNHLMSGKLWKKENGRLVPTNLNAEFKVKK